MPEPLIVPGFNNVAEFDAWVAGLNEADIQAWTSKDWVKMYEQLDKLGVEAANIPESLNKLYTNFRFELADYNNIVKIGQNIGEKMAEGKINIANKTVPNPNYPLNMMDYAQTMDYITWSETKVINKIINSMSRWYMISSINSN